MKCVGEETSVTSFRCLEHMPAPIRFGAAALFCENIARLFRVPWEALQLGILYIHFFIC